ncbi:MAG: LysR family transcriptional regulator [Gammaproteobacteria bacterium]
MAHDLLSCIKNFVAVAQYQGYAKASRHIHISTPVLSKQIKWLEEHLGKTLLLRTSRRQELTEAGEIYLVHARRILEEIEEAKGILHDIDKEPHGQLTLGIPSIFDAIFPSDTLQIFLDKYPKISLSIKADNFPTALTDGQMDLVISSIDTQDKQYVKEHLLKSSRGIFASPAYIKKHGKPKKIADLTKHNCLLYKRIFPTNEWVFTNNKKIRVSGNYESELPLDTFFAAAKGIGLICAPEGLLCDEIKSGKLVKIKLEADPIPINLYLYYLPTAYNTNIKLMADYIKKNIKSFPVWLK